MSPAEENRHSRKLKWILFTGHGRWDYRIKKKNENILLFLKSSIEIKSTSKVMGKTFIRERSEI